MQVCELSASDVAGLEQAGVKPDCRQHNHLRKMDAEERVRSKRFRWIGSKQRAIAATLVATDRGYDNSFGPNDDRVPVITKSGAFLTLQLLHGGEKKK